MKKIFLVILAMVMSVATFAGCSNANTLTVYTNAYFAPFEYYEGTNIVGVDMDIMKMVGTSMKKNVSFKSVEFGSIVASVQGGKADAGAAGITIDDERKQSVDFSKPYFSSVQYVISKKTDEKVYSDLASLEGKKIGVQLGTTGDKMVEKAMKEGELKDKGSSIKQYDNVTLATQALTKGDIDIVVIDKLPAQNAVKINSSTMQYFEMQGIEVEEYGIAVKKGNKELIDAINVVIDDLLANEGEKIFILVNYHSLKAEA